MATKKKRVRRKRTGASKPRKNRIATVVAYGPDDTAGSKLVTSLVKEASGEIEEMRRWYSDGDVDIGEDESVIEELGALLKMWNPNSPIAPNKILGCPHEDRDRLPTRGGVSPMPVVGAAQPLHGRVDPLTRGLPPARPPGLPPRVE